MEFPESSNEFYMHIFLSNVESPKLDKVCNITPVKISPMLNIVGK